MVFWVLAIAVTLIACVALFYAARGRPVNAATADATTSHFRLQLREIEGDIAAGRLGEAEAVAARGEMARELLRLEAEAKAKGKSPSLRTPVVVLSVVAVAALSLGAYAVIGSPTLPSMPLAERATNPEDMTLEAAIAQIEQRLASRPDDVRGWRALAPAYLELRRFDDAERAFRRIIELEGPTADNQTDLAEALMFGRNGDSKGEPMDLLLAAATADPKHVRSHFYLAAEATKNGEYAVAVPRWNTVLALANGDEPWLRQARAGLAVATAGLDPSTAEETLPDRRAINGMVERLAERLAQQGGSVEEWTQLVRSRLVLGQKDQAQTDYNSAVAAYPNGTDRSALDSFAAENGLQTTGVTN